MEKYKLLKNLPDLKAGAIFEYKGHETYEAWQNKQFYYGFTATQIKNNSEWFAEVMEKNCKTCKYENLEKRVVPCNRCDLINGYYCFNAWEPKEKGEKSCDTCMYESESCACIVGDCVDYNKWKAIKNMVENKIEKLVIPEFNDMALVNLFKILYEKINEITDYINKI